MNSVILEGVCQIQFLVVTVSCYVQRRRKQTNIGMASPLPSLSLFPAPLPLEVGPLFQLGHLGECYSRYRFLCILALKSDVF